MSTGGIVRGLMVLAGVIASLASVTPEPVYQVRRSALVPHPAPPPRSGTPPRQRVALAVHDSTVVVPVEPTETPGANAGLYVARHNIGGALRFRIGDNLDVGPLFQTSLEADSMPIAAKPIDPPRQGDAYSIGLGTQYSAPIDARWRVAFGLDWLLALVPYREEGTCIANCGGRGSYVEDGTHEVLIYSLSLTPSYTVDRVTLFGGATVRNHPTNTKSETQTASENEDDADDEVRVGPAYLLLGGGLEYRFSHGASGFLHAYQPVTRSVARYGPVVGVGLTVAFGD